MASFCSVCQSSTLIDCKNKPKIDKIFALKPQKDIYSINGDDEQQRATLVYSKHN